MKKILSIIVCVALISSCGVITKTRYGNGVKVELGNGLFAKREKTEELKAEKAVKVGNLSKVESAFVSNSKINNEEIIQQDTFDKSEYTINDNKLNIKNFNLFNRNTQLKSKVIEKSNYSEIPVEPHAEIAGWLFYCGLVGMFIPIINLFAFLAMLAGFVLAIIALVKINSSEYQLRGKGLAISIIVVYPLIIILSILLIYLILFGLLL